MMLLAVKKLKSGMRNKLIQWNKSETSGVRFKITILLNLVRKLMMQLAVKKLNCGMRSKLIQCNKSEINGLRQKIVKIVKKTITMSLMKTQRQLKMFKVTKVNNLTWSQSNCNRLPRRINSLPLRKTQTYLLMKISKMMKEQQIKMRKNQ